MKFATILNVHNQPELARDTIDSVRLWMTKNILLVVDKKGWPHYEHFSHPDTTVHCGIYHGCHRSPYKNVAIGIKEAYKRWPDVDWYCYMEFDVLLLSDHFKDDLADASRRGVFALGTQHSVKPEKPVSSLVRKIVGVDWLIWHKLLGCLMFFSNTCIKTLVEKHDFFDELLLQTKALRRDEFPEFDDYAVEDFMKPGLPHNKYIVRFAPEVGSHEITPYTTFIHPVKHYDDPIREYYRSSREPLLKYI